MVHYILTEKYHKPKEKQLSIYDLINNSELDEKNLDEIDPRDVNYE